jgi:hypothetical protein
VTPHNLVDGHYDESKLLPQHQTMEETGYSETLVNMQESKLPRLLYELNLKIHRVWESNSLSYAL